MFVLLRYHKFTIKFEVVSEGRRHVHVRALPSSSLFDVCCVCVCLVDADKTFRRFSAAPDVILSGSSSGVGGGGCTHERAPTSYKLTTNQIYSRFHKCLRIL